MKEFICDTCNRPFMRASAQALRPGCKHVFCDRTCAGIWRRKHKTKAERVAEKRAYDMEYRAKNRARLKAEKAAYFQRTYDPAKAAVERKAKMPRHVEYCRRPEYKAWKRQYDADYRAREYGPFAEAYRLLMEIDREIAARMSDYEIRLANGTLNKRLQRRREHEGTFGRQSQAGAVGNPEQHQRRQDAGQSG